VGFVYVGPAPEGSIKTLGSASESYAAQPARSVEAADAYNKGVEARLNALESENARLRNLLPGAPEAAATEPSEATGDADPTFRDLQAHAKELGLNAKGSKEELTQRIADAAAEKESE
jgi:hypothetical protein